VSEATTRRLRVPGLERPAEILVDTAGIPHIRADTFRDIFFVQGFNSARDRLFQIDLWRKRGLGLLAADYGPGFLAQDRAARLLLYRGDMAAEYAAYGNPRTREICEAFAAGINAYIGLAERDRRLRPPEFEAMAIEPARWAAEDVLRIRSHALSRNVESEVARCRVAARVGLEADLARRSLAPAWTVMAPEGIEPGEIPDAVLDVYWLATTEPDISAERLAAGPDQAWRWTKMDDYDRVHADAGARGSNNWVIGPGRTATGRPILASDPHRDHRMPSLRYVVHLSGPGLNVIGATEPPTPGVFIGHNEHVAFGLTICPMDQEDLYVYETHPADPDRYRYADGWESMTRIEEEIPVRGGAPAKVVLKFTRHGPVLHQDVVRNRAYALRSVWNEPGTSAYMGRLAYMDASSAFEFGMAMRHWSAPTVNQICADLNGDIAWFAVGKVPRRPNWDGLLPVPGDGRYEWNGFHPQAALPSAINPERGYIATANEMNLPAGYPYQDRRVGFEWSDPARSRRIHAVLDRQEAHTLLDSMALQCDVTSVAAARVRAMLAGIQTRPADMLRNWNGVLDRASGAALLYEVWWTRHLKPALLDRVTDDEVARPLLAPGDNVTLLDMLETAPDRASLFETTLDRAWETCLALQGSDPAAWRWGMAHQALFEHPLSRVSEVARDVGPLALGGSGATPMCASYRGSDYRITVGASFRMVVDVGDWDNSFVINAPGQSGDPRSPHYDDLATRWANGEYLRLPFSVPAVDAATRLRITLEPD
jgi:penicillin amidase